MQQRMDDHWKRGQQFEAARDLASARAEYETLLAVDGRHIPARLRLSRFEQAQGRYRRARQHALQAADAIRGGAGTRLLSHVTLRLLEFAEEIEVATLVLSVDWDDPHVLAQSPMLAQHLWLAGRYGDALRFLDAVSPRLPPQPLLLFTRANVLRYLGRMDEAAALYEQCLALRPGFADAHWAIATHHRAMPPDARLRRLREALAAHPGEDGERAQLLHALFRELDAAGDTAGAWDALCSGARILHAQARHDAKAETARLEALMRDDPAPAPRSGTAPAQPTPVFIVGLPRTGTTLLDRILGNHGWVTSAGERNDFAAAVSEIADRFFTTLADERDPAALAGLDHRAVGHLYVQRLARHASATAVAIDKNPRNLFNLPLILQALPQAKVLVLERDPMDSAFSNFKEPFQGGAYGYSHDFEALAAHVGVTRRWMGHWARVAPAAVRIVRYESLVADPEATVAGLLDFLGLPHASGLADITRNDAPVATASSAQVREPIHGRGVGAWRRYAAQLEPLRAALERSCA